MLHLEQGDSHVSQELRLHDWIIVYAHLRNLLREPFVNHNIDHQLPDGRRLRTVLVDVDVHVHWNALRQAQLADNGVGHSVFERAGLQGIAEDPRVHKEIPHVLLVFVVILGVLDCLFLVPDELSNGEERLEAFESCGHVLRQIREANGVLLGFLGTVFQNCFEELGVLYGQVSIDVEFFSGSVATGPDGDNIPQETTRDRTVSNRNMIARRRLSKYLGLFLRP
jgi:hypothetical protein